MGMYDPHVSGMNDSESLHRDGSKQDGGSSFFLCYFLSLCYNCRSDCNESHTKLKDVFVVTAPAISVL